MSALLTPPRTKIHQQDRVPYRITVDQYFRMVQSGILGKHDRCEPIEGVLVAKKSRNPPHDNCLHILGKRFYRLLPDEYQCRDQKALILDDGVPEPELVVVRGDETAFAKRHPNSTDVALVVKIADSSLNSDRKSIPIFARNNIPIYWIVNLVDDIVEVYTQPSGPAIAPAYAVRQDFARGDSLPLVLDGKLISSLPVSDLLP